MNNIFHTRLVPEEQELNTYKVVATNASATPYWVKMGGESAILSIMLMGRELGISPMNAISGMFNIIQGKVEISGKGMCYLIRKNGHKLKLKILNPERCILEGQRKDTGEIMEASFTLQEARDAGLIKPGGAWIKSPEDMLYWRALSRLARRLFTDCIGGCYVEGEIQETVEKKSLDKIESANLEDIEIEEIKIDLPENVKIEEFEAYVSYLSLIYKKEISEIKKAANENLTEFWVTFNKWKKDYETKYELEETEKRRV
jgi:hypothetical protein